MSGLQSIVTDASGNWGCGAVSGKQWFQLEWTGLGSYCIITMRYSSTFPCPSLLSLAVPLLSPTNCDQKSLPHFFQGNVCLLHECCPAKWMLILGGPGLSFFLTMYSSTATTGHSSIPVHPWYQSELSRNWFVFYALIITLTLLGLWIPSTVWIVDSASHLLKKYPTVSPILIGLSLSYYIQHPIWNWHQLWLRSLHEEKC